MAKELVWKPNLVKRGVNLVDIDAAIKGSKPEVAAVVIGWDTDFGKPKIQVAAEAILAGADLYCTSFSPAFARRTPRPPLSVSRS